MYEWFAVNMPHLMLPLSLLLRAGWLAIKSRSVGDCAPCIKTVLSDIPSISRELGKLYQHVCKLAFKQKVLSIKYFQHTWLIAHAFLTFVNGLRANAQIGVNYTDVLTSKRTNKRTWRMTWPRKNSIGCDFDNPSMPKCLPTVMSRHFRCAQKVCGQAC